MKTGGLAISIIIPALFILNTTFAQDSVTIVQRPIFIQAAFLYDFSESFGASTGIDFPIKSSIKKISKRNGKIKLKHKELVLYNGLGFYHNPSNYTGVMLTSFINQRHIFHNGLYFENGIGLGVMRTFYEGKVYTVDAENNVEEHNSFGRYYGTIHTALALGINFETRPQSKPFAIQLKPSLWFQYPYNSSVLPHASLELGIKYHFQNWNVHVKQLHKDRTGK